MTYGYARVSTEKQTLERQLINISREYPNATIYSEKYSGKTQERPQWLKLFNKVKSGDTIVFDEVSRMSRSEEEGVKDYFDLYKRGVNLVFLKNSTINTDVYRETLNGNRIAMTNDDVDIILTAINQYLDVLAEKQIRLAFAQAEKERVATSQRTHDIMTDETKARISASRTGKTYDTEKAKMCRDIIKDYSKTFGGNLNDRETMELIRGKLSSAFGDKKNKPKITSKTYYIYKAQVKECL